MFPRWPAAWPHPPGDASAVAAQFLVSHAQAPATAGLGPPAGLPAWPLCGILQPIPVRELAIPRLPSWQIPTERACAAALGVPRPAVGPTLVPPPRLVPPGGFAPGPPPRLMPSGELAPGPLPRPVLPGKLGPTPVPGHALSLPHIPP